MLHWAEVGAVGFVPRDASLEDLVETIESAVRGELRCTATLAAKLVQALSSRERPAAGHAPRSPLTARESEIVQLIDEGLSNKEIAVRLGIEVATVKNHVHNLLEKTAGASPLRGGRPAAGQGSSPAYPQELFSSTDY
jgi:DNA-binding NarL/FixJ family response regulator